jgi:hypothetical protein
VRCGAWPVCVWVGVAVVRSVDSAAESTGVI